MITITNICHIEYKFTTTGPYLLRPVDVGERFFFIVIGQAKLHGDHFRRQRVRASRETRQYAQFVVAIYFVQYFDFRGRHETRSDDLQIYYEITPKY